MSLVNIIVSIAILLSIEITFAATVEHTKVTLKQEQILLELADAGIVETYHVLANFYADRATEKNRFLKKSIPWLIKSSQFGHANSLYKLAQLGLNLEQYSKQLNGIYITQSGAKKIWRKESLVLSSAAAILGHKTASIDLVMLPKIQSFTYVEIDTAVNEALSRLEKGHIINCNFFVCADDIPITVDEKLLNKFNMKIIAFNKNRNAKKCRSLKYCLELNLASSTTIDQKKIKIFQANLKEDNRPKIKKYERLQTEATQKLNASLQQQNDIDRNNKRIQAALKIVDHFALDDRKQLTSKISELLEKINFHRSENNQIGLTDVMQILSQP